MPAPYQYDVPQFNVGSYLEAARQGRTDRLTVENDQKMNALSKYLPGALQGDKEKQAMALQVAPVDQMANLAQRFSAMGAEELAKKKAEQAESASLAAWADTPEKWAIANAKWKEKNPGAPDVPFEQRGMLMAQSQTVADMLDQEWKAKSFGLQQSQFAESRRHNQVIEQRGAGGGGNAPQGYQWTRAADGSVTLAPIKGGPADPNRIAPGEGVKVRASNAQLDALEQSLKSYIENLDKTSAFGRVVSRGADVSKVETGHTDLLMQMKNLYELGVLNGPDYMLMTKIVEDPTSFMQLARGTEGLKAQTDTVKSIIARSRNINNAKLGLPPTTTTNPPPPGDYRTDQRTLLNGQGGATRPTIPPPPGAIEMLRSNPNMAADFDRKYGPGSAQRVLSGQ